VSGLRTEDRAPVFLLDWDIGGQIVRVSSGAVDANGRLLPVQVSDDAGRTYTYPPGLEVDTANTVLEDVVSVFDVEVRYDLDWAEFEARGGMLDRLPATLRLWFPGQTLEQARVLVRGETQLASYGLVEDPVGFSIVSDHTDGASVLPPPGATVSSDTWPVSTPNYDFAPNVDGAAYPVVIGYPGHHPTPGAAADIPDPAVPALYVEREDPNISGNDYWLFAIGSVEATKVNLWNMSVWPPEESATATGGSTVTEAADKLGRTVSGIRTGVLTDEGDRYWVGFQNDGTYGGGMKSEYGDHVMRGAGEVIRWVYSRHSRVDIDEGRMIGAQSYLDRYLVDTWFNSRVNMVEWLRESILVDLPVVGVQGPNGFYFAPMRWGATSKDAVARLDITGRAWAREGGLSKWDEPIRNSVTVNYRWSEDRRFASTRTLTAEGQLWTDALGRNQLPALPWYATTADARILGDGLAAKSQAQFGVYDHTRELKWTFDDNTALRVAHDVLLRNAWPKRQGRCIGSLDGIELRPGDVVLVNDDEMHLADRVALVLDTVVSVDEMAVDYLLLDHPFNEPKKTS